jgi:hypothetical protein
MLARKGGIRHVGRPDLRLVNPRRFCSIAGLSAILSRSSLSWSMIFSENRFPLFRIML